MLRAKFSSVSTEVFVSYVKTTSFSFPSEQDERVYCIDLGKHFWNTTMHDSFQKHNYAWLLPVSNSDSLPPVERTEYKTNSS